MECPFLRPDGLDSVWAGHRQARGAAGFSTRSSFRITLLSFHTVSGKVAGIQGRNSLRDDHFSIPDIPDVPQNLCNRAHRKIRQQHCIAVFAWVVMEFRHGQRLTRSEA